MLADDLRADAVACSDPRVTPEEFLGMRDGPCKSEPFYLFPDPYSHAEQFD